MVDLVESESAQTKSRGCDEAFDASSGEAIKLKLAGFDTSVLDPENVHHADVARRSLISTCTGMEFENVELV